MRVPDGPGVAADISGEGRICMSIRTSVHLHGICTHGIRHLDSLEIKSCLKAFNMLNSIHLSYLHQELTLTLVSTVRI
jgi:hypothetical protein